MVEDKIVQSLSPIFSGRVYPDVMPQSIPQNDITPCCVYTIISQTPLFTSSCNDYTTQTIVQIDIYTASDKVNIIRERISLFKATCQVLTDAGFSFKQSRNSFDNDFRLYRVSIDFIY